MTQRIKPDLDTSRNPTYVTTDDLPLLTHSGHPSGPLWASPRNSRLRTLTLAALQALLGFTSEAGFIRHAHAHLRPWFSFCRTGPGTTNDSARAGELFQHVIAYLARGCPSWHGDAMPRVSSAEHRHRVGEDTVDGRLGEFDLA